MKNLVIYAPNAQDPIHLRNSLANDISDEFSNTYKVHLVQSLESLSPLIHELQPHALVICFDKFNKALLESLYKQMLLHNFGLMIISSSYNLKDELTAFELGADHYLLASTSADSIYARIRSMTSKRYSDTPRLPQKVHTLRFKKIEVHSDDGVVKFEDNLIKLTPTQFRLLQTFVSHTDEVLTREWLQQNVFQNKNISLRSIDAHIAKLKAALPYLQKYLMNFYGRGYCLKLSEKEVA